MMPQPSKSVNLSAAKISHYILTNCGCEKKPIFALALIYIVLYAMYHVGILVLGYGPG